MMGAEFLKKRNRGYDKHIDKKRAALVSRDLFTRTPTDKPRRIIAKIKGGAKLNEGDSLIVEKRGDKLTGCSGNKVVAESLKVSPGEIDAVVKANGVATGTIEKVNALSGTVELSLC